jgi:hypothetical protein
MHRSKEHLYSITPLRWPAASWAQQLAEIRRLLAAFESGLVLRDQNRRAQARANGGEAH